MKHIAFRVFCFTLLLSAAHLFAKATPYYSIRSQSVNAARDLVGWSSHINLCCEDDFYGSFTLTPAYNASFRSDDIACCLFGDSIDCECECPTIKISGSRVANRGEKDWLADYFGLPTDFESEVKFKPEIDTFLVDFNWYFGLEHWADGMYARIHFPIVHTRWKMNMCESVGAEGTNDHDPGYFSPLANSGLLTANGVARTNLLRQFSDFVTGNQVPTLPGADNVNYVENVENVIFNKLCNSRIASGTKRKTAVGDLRGAIGWNFFRGADYHMGLNIQAAAPTGSRPKGEYLFEPIAGNGKHWELGLGLTAHRTIWRNEEWDKSFGVYLDINVTKMFKTCQRRSFDLINGDNSRYMLAQKMGVPTVALRGSEAESVLSQGSQFEVAPQFQHEYTPVANLTTFNVDVQAAQADLALMFNYTCDCYSVDFGYNFWGRACEDIEIKCDDCDNKLLNNTTWALKGDSFSYGFTHDEEDACAATANTPIALSATQSQATINSGKNTPTGTAFVDPDQKRNPGIDKPVFATSTFDNGTTHCQVNYTTGLSNVADVQQRTSAQPQLIDLRDVDISGARTRGLSHKFFAHFNYNWKNLEHYLPFLGIGFEVEFAQKPNKLNTRTDDNGCPPCNRSIKCAPCKGVDCCRKCAVSQWGIWVKGGVSY